jgi:putative ABC transport system permease protein
VTFLTRVIRNISRGRIRTLALVAVVSLSLAAFLILSQIGTDVGANVDAARAAVANVVTVSSADGSGFFGTSTHISGSIVSTVRYTPGVASAQRILLETPGFNGSGGAPSGGSGGGGGGRGNFTLYEGIDTTAPVTLFGGFGGGSSLTVISGRTLNASDEDSDVALVGETFASDNSLTVGSSIGVNGTAMTVVGIFSTGGGFGDRNVILPYPASQTAFAASGPNLIYVKVYSTDNVTSTVQVLREELGTNYSVTALGQNAGGGFANSIGSILSSTALEQYAALALGAAVVVVVMVLVTSQRTREIGLLKAFGFTNSSILSQLVAESVLVSLAGLPVALALTVWIGPSVAQDVLGSATGGFGGRRFGGGFAGGFFGSINFSLTPSIVLLGAVITLGFGMIGAIYPILRALRLKPSETLRHD